MVSTISYWLHQTYIDHFFAIFRIMDPGRNDSEVFAADLFRRCTFSCRYVRITLNRIAMLPYVQRERCIGFRCVGNVFSLRTDTSYINVTPAMFRSCSLGVLCLSHRERSRDKSMANPIGKPVASVRLYLNILSKTYRT